MKFYEIPLDVKFRVLATNEEYKKIKEERITCCKVKHNAIKLSNNEHVVIKPMEQVEVIN
jgi:hypothetical protein